MKRIAALFTGILALVFYSITVGYAATEYEIQIPDGSRKVCFDSSRRGAFVCSFDNRTVYSTMLLPDFYTYKVTVSGNVKSVRQSGSLTYALFGAKMPNDYSLLELSPQSGACRYYTINNENDFDVSCFSVSDGCLYIIKKDAVYAYVKSIRLSDYTTKIYKFDTNVTEIFNNNGVTYAVLYDGSVYRLSKSGSSYCTSVNQGSKISNAGVNFISISAGTVVSLQDGTRTYISNVSENCVSLCGNNTFYAISNIAYLRQGGSTKSFSLNSAARAVLCHGGKAAVLTKNSKCVILDCDDYKSYSLPQNNTDIKNTYENYEINSDGILYRVESGTTVAQFKNSFPSAITVYDKSGNTVTSGKVKTGFKAEVSGNIYQIAVAGDLTGEGNTKSNDVSALMECFVGIAEMSDLTRTAADFNFDSSADNRDLVLIARKANTDTS